MKYEVEQKYRVDDLQVVERKLISMGVTMSGPVEQIDSYFNHPSRDFAQTDEALRIRCMGDANRITYKGPKIDQTTKTRRELELPLVDGTETASGFADLLSALGFHLVSDVRKHRRSGVLDWRGHPIEVALDEVHGVGTFVELEQQTDATGVEDAKQRLAEIAERLALHDVERRGYLELLLSR